MGYSELPLGPSRLSRVKAAPSPKQTQTPKLLEAWARARKSPRPSPVLGPEGPAASLYHPHPSLQRESERTRLPPSHAIQPGTSGIRDGDPELGGWISWKRARANVQGTLPRKFGKVPESLPSSGDSSGHASSDSAVVEGTGAEVKLLAEPEPG